MKIDHGQFLAHPFRPRLAPDQFAAFLRGERQPNPGACKNRYNFIFCAKPPFTALSKPLLAGRFVYLPLSGTRLDCSQFRSRNNGNLAMKALSRSELSLMLVWAFRDERVESAANPHVDAVTLYCNVMALPVAEAAAIVGHAREGNVPPIDPVALARWTRGVNLLRQMLQQPMCDLSIATPESPVAAEVAA